MFKPKAIEDRKVSIQSWINQYITFVEANPKYPKHMQLLLDPESQNVLVHISRRGLRR